MNAKHVFILGLSLAIAGCGSNDTNTSAPNAKASTGQPASSSSNLPLVAFAQANSQDPWRQVFDRDTKAAADQHASEFKFEEQEAEDDVNKQVNAIDTLMVKKPKVLLVSPVTEAAETAVAKAHDQGAFVVLLDRSVPGEKWDAYVGGDNTAIGAAAGSFMAEKLHGKGVVLMIRGIADAKPTKSRAEGFMTAMKAYPGITVIQGDDCGYQRQKARTYMENFLQSKKPFDAVYAHNDEMAIGAYLAMADAKTPKKLLVGIDGCQKEVVQYIKDGKMDATFSYPDPGPKGIEIAADYLKGTKPKERNIVLPTEKVTKENADDFLAKHPNLAG